MSGERIRVTDPATGKDLGEVPDQGESDVDAAVGRARKAQPAWAALGFRGRARQLRRFVRVLRDDPALMETLVAETGKPRYEAEAIELFYLCELTRFFTGRTGRRALADDLRRPHIFANKRARVVQHPRGVVGVIGPWNWPILNNFADAVAPLVAGNTVVLKPSEHTPLTSLHVARRWREAGMPESVLEVVTGRGPTGAALVERADMIFFTGSQAVGRRIASRCGERLVPVVLELGGKSPMIVLADADLRRAAHAAVWSAFANSGQVCVRTERVIVEASVADAFTQLVAAETARLRHGPPAVEPDVGAITFPNQIAVAESQIADALARGARLVSGGKRRTDLPGSFFEPTVLANVTPAMAVAAEETFAPLLPILSVRDADEALRLANDTPLGLSGSVWSRDTRRARDLARKLEAGSVCVNDVLVNYFCVEAPLGGIKASGLGLRHGPEALRQFCRSETIVEDHPILGIVSPFVGRQLTFPYQSRVLRAIRWLMKHLY